MPTPRGDAAQRISVEREAPLCVVQQLRRFAVWKAATCAKICLDVEVARDVLRYALWQGHRHCGQLYGWNARWLKVLGWLCVLGGRADKRCGPVFRNDILRRHAGWKIPGARTGTEDVCFFSASGVEADALGIEADSVSIASRPMRIGRQTRFQHYYTPRPPDKRSQVPSHAFR